MSKLGRRRRTSNQRVADRILRSANEQDRREQSAQQFAELILGGSLNQRIDEAHRSLFKVGSRS
jgi:ribosomal protein S3AE